MTAWFNRLPFNWQCICTVIAICVTLFVIAAVIDYNQQHKREARLARKRRRERVWARELLRKPAENVYRHAFREHKR